MSDIPADALEEKFLAATGPAGQNVNKVATACQLRVDGYKLGLDPESWRRLRELAGSRMTASGTIVITAPSVSEQERTGPMRGRGCRLAGSGRHRERGGEDEAEQGGKGTADRRQEGARRGEGGAGARDARLKNCTPAKAGVRTGFPPSREYIARMYDFQIATTAKAELYRDLTAALEALTAGEPDGIRQHGQCRGADLAVSARPQLAGFYRNLGGELVLGPFQGKLACIRIPFGKGVCGTAAATRSTQVVADVHAFPGHIACDVASRSELVVPIVWDGALIAVLDLDSPQRGRFDADDAVGCEALAKVIASRI